MCDGGHSKSVSICYCRYAKHLEELGKIQEAIQYYEKSNTHLQQVPRMLVEKDIHGLETYIVKSREPQFYKWWAQYLESQGDTEEALRYYELAKDFVSLVSERRRDAGKIRALLLSVGEDIFPHVTYELSRQPYAQRVVSRWHHRSLPFPQVRINCFFNNVDTAMEIANDVGDRAACFHLARHLESIDRPSDSVHFFSKVVSDLSGRRMQACSRALCEAALAS